jgi:hypothetical protein
MNKDPYDDIDEKALLRPLINNTKMRLEHLFPFACTTIYCQGAAFSAIIRPRPQDSPESNMLYPAKVLIYTDERMEGLWVYQKESEQFYGLSKRYEEHPVFGPGYYAYNGFLGRLEHAYHEKVCNIDQGLNGFVEEIDDVFIFNGEMTRRNGEDVECALDIMCLVPLVVGDKVTIDESRFTVTQVIDDFGKQVVTIVL